MPSPQGSWESGRHITWRERIQTWERKGAHVVNQRRQEKSGPGRVAAASSFPEDTNTEKELASVGWGRAGGGGAKPDTPQVTVLRALS